MHLTYSLSWFLYISIGLFFLFYLLYWLKLRRISFALSSPVLGRVYIKFFVRALAFLSLLIALLGPMFGNESQSITIDKKRLLFLVDVSLSMDARDVTPSRLEKSKQLIKRICSQTPGYEYSLIVYSGHAIVQCPFTKDVDAFLVYVASISTQRLSDKGSYPITALSLAYHMAQRTESDAPTLLLILSDGESFLPTIANDSLDSWTSVFDARYWIGIGSTDGSRIPDQAYFKKDAQGNYIITRLLAADLQQIAHTTAGQYYEISDQTDQSTPLIQSIRFDLLKKNDTDILAIESNRYRYFLFLTFGLLLIDMLFSFKTIRL